MAQNGPMPKHYIEVRKTAEASYEVYAPEKEAADKAQIWKKKNVCRWVSRVLRKL